MGKKKKRSNARAAHTQAPSRLEEFTRQDENDPRTYAGRKRERVRLGGVGDDGLPMTRNRLNAHRTLNVFFIWGLACVAIGAIAGAASFFQGGTIDGWTMVSSGGALLNGIELPTLLRFEGLYCLITGAVFFGSSFLGFSWLYDGAPRSATSKWVSANVVIAVIWQATALYNVQLIEPVSLISLVALACFAWFSHGVEQERRA